MVVVLHDSEPRQVPQGASCDGQLWIPTADLERVCGWAWRDGQLCRGDSAVSAEAGTQGELLRDGRVDVAALWRHLEWPVLSSEAGDVWVLGASADERAQALQSLEAPDFTLPDLDGNPHSLSDYRGKKVYLVSWASW